MVVGGQWWLLCWINGKDSEAARDWKDEADLLFLHFSKFLLGPSSRSKQRHPNEFQPHRLIKRTQRLNLHQIQHNRQSPGIGSLHSFMCMSWQCTFCDRGQQEDRFIPVQLRTITHRLRAFHPEVITSDSNNQQQNHKEE